ncbi:MAG: ClpXP protease specificity-enhancing factor [Sterolibacterium sp.]|nr:ClpXP protease specificity-enhancing factor [Sterolibacterium sp.]
MAQIPSTKPYLIRAIHEWCIDQGCTPYLAVVVNARTRVPREYVKDGQIVLNLGPEATHQLIIGNELITFSARFNGVAQTLSIPIDNVAAIYARENGQGLTFEVALPGDKEKVGTDQVSKDEPPQHPAPSGHPHLTRIK